ncbi:hypothetical protein NP493_588g01017 [Ridgeia piscesae]|uniref:Alkylated DNA repair protein AlkB homologue 8 N-terminal domain-containing protein n=1 Tax=Ridgeia piscesae TaxID=27915 RepID=A0AAD9NPJ2_RIDPI|nr:hypothetical protein NP493_588g01017 [Ridgeia piscesae]
MFVRFSGDTAMLAPFSDFASYQSYLSSVVRFSSWCSANFLHLNVSKTKEICIDFRRNRTVISPIAINGEPVEQVDSFKYLGVVLDTKLTFTEHLTAVQKKSQQRLHVLRKLRAFSVDPKPLLCLYRSITEPLIMYCSTYYYHALSVSNRTRLLKISHVAAKIIGLSTPMLSLMIDHAILKKARAVAAESDHPLFTYVHVLPSRKRYRYIKCNATPRHATPRHATPRHATPRHATPRHATPRHATPRHATPRHATPRHATPRHATPRHATPRHATPRHATPRHATHHFLQFYYSLHGYGRFRKLLVSNVHGIGSRFFKTGFKCYKRTFSTV